MYNYFKKLIYSVKFFINLQVSEKCFKSRCTVIIGNRTVFWSTFRCGISASLINGKLLFG